MKLKKFLEQQSNFVIHRFVCSWMQGDHFLS